MYVLQPFRSETQWERLALAPADPGADAERLGRLILRGGPEFTRFLVDFGLAPMWHFAITSKSAGSQLPGACTLRLQEARMGAAARYLAQQGALRQLDWVFERAGIAYAVMKGVAIRERMHEDPSVMPANDVDVLVASADRLKATALLVEAGFVAHLDPGNISHEILLQSPSADIDLHWNILRPGRTRIDLTVELLSRRVRVSGFWALSDSDSTFVMLTHPAFSKYICSPHMGLGRVMGFLLWLKKADSHWSTVVEMLGRTGLKTAAWAMLGWYMGLAPAALRPMMTGWRNGLRPGPFRSAYLDCWLRHNLPSRLITRPLAIQFGLTAFLHDHPSDALTAYRGWYSAKRDRNDDANAFYGIPGVLA